MIVRYAVRPEYAIRFGREVLTVWSGAFASTYEGKAVELPRHDGYMITLYGGRKVRVSCETPRTNENFVRIDAAIDAAIIAALGDED